MKTAATIAATTPHRSLTVSRSPLPGTVCKPTSGPKRARLTTAAISESRSEVTTRLPPLAAVKGGSPATAAARCSSRISAPSGRNSAVGWSLTSAAMSDFLYFGFAKQPRGQKDQRDGEDREGGDVLVFDREIRR